MVRFPLTMRLLLAAITVLGIFAAVCFAATPGAAVLAAKGVLSPAYRADRNGGHPSSAIVRHAKARELKSQETY